MLEIVPPGTDDPLADALGNALTHYAKRCDLTLDQAIFLMTVGRLHCIAGVVPLVVVACATH